MAEEEKQGAETTTDEGQEKQTGRVKWFSNARGFGFITPDNGGDDLFVHQAAIHAEGFRSLCEGEAVEYTVEQGDDGRYRAVNVTGPEGAYVQGTSSRSRHGGRSSSKKTGNSCFTCGEPGHVARECTNPGASGAGKRGSSGGSSASCFTCGQPGHFARDCTSAPPATSA